MLRRAAIPSRWWLQRVRRWAQRLTCTGSLPMLQAVLRRPFMMLLLLLAMVGVIPCVACGASAAAGSPTALLDWHLEARAPRLRLPSCLIDWLLRQHPRRRLRRWGRRPWPQQLHPPAGQGTHKQRLVRLALPQLGREVNVLWVAETEAFRAACLLEDLGNTCLPAVSSRKGRKAAHEAAAQRRMRCGSGAAPTRHFANLNQRRPARFMLHIFSNPPAIASLHCELVQPACALL